MEKEFTLRNKIEESRAWHLQHFGELNWQWTDEGLPNAILDYHSSKGSVLDFTADDEAVCMENGWTMEEVIDLCEREPDTGVTIEMYRQVQAEKLLK